MTRHPGTSTIRRGQRRQDLHRGRLAGTVGAEQRNDLTAAHVEGDVAQRGNRTERFADAFDIHTFVGL